MNEHHINIYSTCPYCAAGNPRKIRMAKADHRGKHTCTACGKIYIEHYRVTAVLNTYPAYLENQPAQEASTQ